MEKRLYDIIDLFKKAYLDKLSASEKPVWDELIENEQFRKLWEELKSGELVWEGMEDAIKFPAKQGYLNFKKRRISGKRIRRRIYFVVGTVAAVLVILINIVLGLFKQDDFKPVEVATSDGIFPVYRGTQLLLGSGDTLMIKTGTQVLQGRDGALLKNTDGSVVRMDSDTMRRIVYNELLVPVGGECFIMLEDSSKVWLNADSRLKYPNYFAGGERRVTLEGEAYFEVSKGERPFIVETKKGEIRVLGTSFGVRIYPEEAMMTTLVSGQVMYKGTKDSVLLKPGEQIMVSMEENIVKRKVDVEEYVGWRNGVYVFDRRPLIDIMRDLERWYGVAVIFETTDLEELPFTGYIKRYDKIDTFLQLLENTGELTYQIDANRNIFLRKK